MRILLIEDHSRLAGYIADGLKDVGFSVDHFGTAADGEAAAHSMAYDAIIVDLGLPDRDGLELIRSLRTKSVASPILILTARDRIEDRVSGLDEGADDYLLKPFFMSELAARLRALMRRPGGVLGSMLEVGDVVLDTNHRELRVAGAIIAATRRELDILELLMRRPGQVISKRRIEDTVYGPSSEVFPGNAIEAAISRLRKRLESAGSKARIHTMRGIGYLMLE